MSTPPDDSDWGWLEPEGSQEPVRERLTAWSAATLERTIGSPILFGIVYTSLASAVFFSLGVVVDHALGLTPLVFLIAALLFGLTALTYVEGASLHQEPGGSTVFARYAFNELVSFVAGWAILLDYIILIAVCAYAATQYLKVFWAPLGHHTEALVLALAIIAYVVLSNIRGLSSRRGLRIGVLVVGALVLELFVIALGLVLYFNPHTLWSSIHLGSAPSWSGLIFALTITTMAFTSVEYASGLAGEVIASRRALQRLLVSGIAVLVLAYVGVALLAVTAFPIHGTYSALAHRYLDDPVIGLVDRLRPHALSQVLRYAMGAVVAVTLIAAANSAMLGLSRLAYSLSTNRQIPSRPRAPAPAALHALAADPARRPARRRAGDPREHRLPRRHLRLRGGALVHDRPPLGDTPALPRAPPPPPVPHAAVGALPRGPAAAAGGARRAALRRRVGRAAGRPPPRPLRRARLDGRRPRALPRLPPSGRELAAAARHRRARGAAARAAARARLRLDPRAAARGGARR